MLKAGVSGAGAFGARHAQKYAGLASVRLVAVHDPDQARAEALAGLHGARAFTDYTAFLDACDVVSVTAPAQAHGDLALTALEAGRPVYVEKPLAASLADGRLLVAAAERRGLALACGHQERLLLEALGLFPGRVRPHAIEAWRLGPPSGRGEDVSCVLDLMVHDLDFALAVMGDAEVAGAAGDAHDAHARLFFAAGGDARFAASRRAEARLRKLRLSYPTGAVEIDWIEGRILDDAGFGLPERLGALCPDPLGLSIARFVEAAAGEAARPAVTGAEGLRVLELALAIDALRLPRAGTALRSAAEIS